MKKALAVVAAAAAATVSSLAFTVPASATVECKEIAHWNVDGVNLHIKAEPDQALSNATAVILSEGIELTTPDTPAKVQFFTSVSNVKLNSITQLKYQTKQLNPSVVALPAYQIQIDKNGGSLETNDWTTLVFEPYLQPGFDQTETAWHTWDAINGGDALWWSTKASALTDLPNNAGMSHPAKASAIVAAYPNATVLAYGWNMGSGNAGAHAVLNKFVFGSSSGCAKHNWNKNASPAPSNSTSPSPSTSVTPSVTSSPTAAVPGAPSGSLPVTGSKIWVLAGSGALLVAAGMAFLIIVRKRDETKFITE